MITELYRHFDSKDNLLYVGISFSSIYRLAGHKHKSSWFNSINKIEIERHATRELALIAEKAAIKNESPLFNIVHNKQTPRDKTKELLSRIDQFIKYCLLRREGKRINKVENELDHMYGDHKESICLNISTIPLSYVDQIKT